MGRQRNGGPVDPTVQAARINRRGTLITALATVIAALIGGLFAAYKVGNDQGAAAAPPRTVTVTATKPPDAPTGAAPVSDVSAQVRLDARTGADLDAADPHAVETSGPNGDVDVYYSGVWVTVNRAAMYAYSGGEKAASTACPRVVADDKPVSGGQIILIAGNQFCMRTSEGKVGWVGCNDVQVPDYVVLNYRLFATT